MTVENIVIYQGADFQRNIALTDANNNALNVSGFSANASMKIDPYSSNGVVTTFDTNLTNGNLEIYMPANTTIGLSPGWYQFDVMIWNGTVTYRVMEGIAYVDAGITLSNTGV